jgi:hypothetical protein
MTQSTSNISPSISTNAISKQHANVDFSFSKDLSLEHKTITSIGVIVAGISALVLTAPAVLNNNSPVSYTSTSNTSLAVRQINLNDDSYKTPFKSSVPSIQQSFRVVKLSARISGSEQYDIWS